MLSQEEARARVAKGAAHLDQVRPGWFTDVDTGTLTMSSPCGCVLAQAFVAAHDRDGDAFCRGAEAAGLGWTGPGKQTVTHGFFADMSSEYVQLQDAWVEAIADRRLSQGTHEAPVTVDAVDPVGHLVTG